MLHDGHQYRVDYRHLVRFRCRSERLQQHGMGETQFADKVPNQVAAANMDVVCIEPADGCSSPGSLSAHSCSIACPTGMGID